MASLEERLASMKAKQEAADTSKKEAEEKIAAEQAAAEHEVRRGDLGKEREAVTAELATAEQAANEAQNAVAQAEAFAAEQGENLDPETKAEIDAIKAEAAETGQKLELLKAEIARIDAELAGPEEAGAAPAEAEAEMSTEIQEKSVKELEKEVSLLVNEVVKSCELLEATDFAKIENPEVQLAELKRMRETSFAKFNELIEAELAKEGPKKARLVLQQMQRADVFRKLDNAINKLAMKANSVNPEKAESQLQVEYSSGEAAEALKMTDWNIKLAKAEAPDQIDEGGMVKGELVNLKNQMWGEQGGLGMISKLGPESLQLVKQRRDEIVKSLLSIHNLKSEKELFVLGEEKKIIENLDRGIQSAEKSASKRRL